MFLTITSIVDLPIDALVILPIQPLLTGSVALVFSSVFGFEDFLNRFRKFKFFILVMKMIIIYIYGFWYVRKKPFLKDFLPAIIYDYADKFSSSTTLSQ